MILKNGGYDHVYGHALGCNQLKSIRNSRADRETDRGQQYSILIRAIPPALQAWDWISLWSDKGEKTTTKQCGGHTRCAKETLHCLEGYSEAKGQKKNTVDEGCEDLGSMPTVRVSGSWS
jgi:hypothetical protein